ncbi:MAG TPA: hypothetical protein VFK27_04085 [Bacillales bacterium]|nr:hypothetical protein [Bacillales bacterium]
MQLQEALYNWLSIKKVADERPDDTAARDTHDFFLEILEEDHGVEIDRVDLEQEKYIVRYRMNGEEKTADFPRSMIDSLLRSIKAEPRYNEQ